MQHFLNMNDHDNILNERGPQKGEQFCSLAAVYKHSVTQLCLSVVL